MFFCDRIVPYKQFVDLLADAEHHKLCLIPKPALITDLTDGADIALTLVEMGHGEVGQGRPYHHRVEALVLFGSDTSRFEVCITEELWRALPTREEWWNSKPKIIVAAEVYDEIVKELDAPTEPSEALIKAAKKARENIRSGVPARTADAAELDAVAEIRAERDAEDPEGEEDGGTGVLAVKPGGDPAPTTEAKRAPRKRAARAPKATESDTAETVPVEAAVQ